MISKNDKDGFKNVFNYWEVFGNCEKIGLFTKDGYIGYINHLIGLGILDHHEDSGGLGGGISRFLIMLFGLMTNYINVHQN